MATKQRLIDANARIEEIKQAHCTGCESYDGVRCRACWVDDAIGLIEDATTVDAVEVVRCRECRFCDTEDCPMRGTPGEVSASDFCSYGERRTDNEKS